MKNKLPKKYRHALVSRISEAAELPIDTLMGLPLIKMSSNREIFVEDAGVLEHYDDECVRLSQGKILISVSGRDLRLKCLADNNIRVSGYILNVGFEAKGGA